MNLTTDGRVEIRPNTEVSFSYEVSWKKSDVKFADRFDKYLDPSFFQHRVGFVLQPLFVIWKVLRTHCILIAIEMSNESCSLAIIYMGTVCLYCTNYGFLYCRNICNVLFDLKRTNMNEMSESVFLSSIPHPSPFQIHWFSIFNSFMMVVFLVGLVWMILVRTLKRDYARYQKEDSDELVCILQLIRFVFQPHHKVFLKIRVCYVLLC